MKRKFANACSYLFPVFLLCFSALFLLEIGDYITSQAIVMLGISSADAGLSEQQFPDASLLGGYLSGQINHTSSLSEAGERYLAQSGYAYSAPELLKRNAYIHFLPFFAVFTLVSTAMLLYQFFIRKQQETMIAGYRQQVFDLEKQLETQTHLVN